MWRDLGNGYPELVDFNFNYNGGGANQYVGLTFDNCDLLKPWIDGGESYALYVAMVGDPDWACSTREFFLSAAWESGVDKRIRERRAGEPSTPYPGG